MKRAFWLIGAGVLSTMLVLCSGLFFPHAKYRRRFRLCDNGGGLGRVGIYFCPCCA